MRHMIGEVGHIVHPRRCVGGHMTGEVGHIVQPMRCVGGHVCVAGQPGMLVGGGHVCDDGQPGMLVGGHVCDDGQPGMLVGGHVCDDGQPGMLVGGHVCDDGQPGMLVGGHVCDDGQPGMLVGGGQSCGDVGHIVHPSRCVGGQSCGDVGHTVHPSRCVGGMVSVGHTGSDGGQCWLGGHVFVGGHPSSVVGHGWHDTLGCDGGQWPGGQVRLCTVGHGWHEYAGCDTGHSGHVMCTDGQFGGAESGGLPPPLLHASGGHVTKFTVGHGTCDGGPAAPVPLELELEELVELLPGSLDMKTPHRARRERTRRLEKSTCVQCFVPGPPVFGPLANAGSTKCDARNADVRIRTSKPIQRRPHRPPTRA